VVGLRVAQEADESVIMPNHCNGIIMITYRAVGADLRVGPVPQGAYTGAPLQHRLTAPPAIA
jgi:hypothetical protein